MQLIYEVPDQVPLQIRIPEMIIKPGGIICHYPSDIDQDSIGRCMNNRLYILIHIHGSPVFRKVGLDQPDRRTVPPGGVITARIKVCKEIIRCLTAGGQEY
jgi:hypothetical protein